MLLFSFIVYVSHVIKKIDVSLNALRFVEVQKEADSFV
jgi:hypothetical protein